jgi:hypothetical protein
MEYTHVYYHHYRLLDNALQLLNKTYENPCTLSTKTLNNFKMIWKMSVSHCFKEINEFSSVTVIKANNYTSLKSIHSMSLQAKSGLGFLY